MDEMVHRSLTVRSGARSAICQWLIGFLLEPARFKHDGRNCDYALIMGGKYLINVQALAKAWDTYVTNEPCPPTGKIASALSAICTSERKQLRLNGRKINYRVVNIDNLIAWASHAEVTDEETINNALAINNLADTTKPLVN
jgi:hypothetical protein